MLRRNEWRGDTRNDIFVKKKKKNQIFRYKRESGRYY